MKEFEAFKHKLYLLTDEMKSVDKSIERLETRYAESKLLHSKQSSLKVLEKYLKRKENLSATIERLNLQIATFWK